MGRRTFLRLGVHLALVAGLLAASDRLAEAKEGPRYKSSCAAKQSRKFMRGVGNTLFFWAEIPKNVFRETYSTDPLTGFFCGLGKGIRQGGCRLKYGVWETVTFLSPRDRNYQPYIQPEFVLMDEADLTPQFASAEKRWKTKTYTRSDGPSVSSTSYYMDTERVSRQKNGGSIIGSSVAQPSIRPAGQDAGAATGGRY